MNMTRKFQPSWNPHPNEADTQGTIHIFKSWWVCAGGSQFDWVRKRLVEKLALNTDLKEVRRYPC